jgi:hypothetical protein
MTRCRRFFAAPRKGVRGQLHKHRAMIEREHLMARKFKMKIAKTNIQD